MGKISAFGYPSNSQVREYNAKLTNYFVEYEKYLNRINATRQAVTRAFAIFPTLENTGNGPAEDVDVEISFPDVFWTIGVSDSDEIKAIVDPKAPDPPKKPEAFDYSFSIPDNLREIKRPEPEDVPKITHRPDGTHLFHARLARLKHSNAWVFGTILAFFKSWDVVHPFETKYIISVANHPKISTGTLVIKVGIKA